MLKLNYGQYWWNPGADFLFNVSPNVNGGWNKRYAWMTASRDHCRNGGSGIPGNRGTSLRPAAAPPPSRSIRISRTLTRSELATWFERELIANFGVRTGFVWRGQRQRYPARQHVPARSRTSRVPITIPDPGPDNIASGTPTMDRRSRASIWPRQFVGRTSNVQTNVPDSDSDFYTWEITGTKRFSNRWSLLASFAHTWVKEFANGYFGNTVRQIQPAS